MLCQLVAKHLATFLARLESDPSRVRLPGFVLRELNRYLDCGILANGFARLHCLQCGRDGLVAFSCKGRGFCPSCGGRRMADTAAWLVDRVIPRVPVRQWVLTLPFPMLSACAYDPALCKAVRGIFVRTVFTLLRRKSRACGVLEPKLGQPWSSCNASSRRRPATVGRLAVHTSRPVWFADPRAQRSVGDSVTSA